MSKIRDDEGPQDRPAIALDPMITTVEVDMRARVQIDLRQLLQVKGVTIDAGEPSAPQLHHYLISLIERFVRAQVYVLDGCVSWLDADLEARALDPDRIWRRP